MNLLSKFKIKLRSFKLPELAFCILLSSNTIFTQQGPSDLIKTYKISFPIRELGNCANYAQCRDFCEDPLNRNSCVAFTRQKGIYEDLGQKKKEIIVDLAKKELGCDSHKSCETFCEQKENYEKCNSFAQRNNLFGGYQTHKESLFLEKAKSVLGCSSYETCNTYCQQEVNQDICTRFARNLGIKGGTETKGPGNCTSVATCDAYCSNPNNFEECANFADYNKTAEFKGPGGCTSTESCKAYCDKNPKECYGYSLLPYTPSDSFSACTKIAGCRWTGTTCQCIGPVSDPQTSCIQTPGCLWEGTSCKCSAEGSKTINFVDPVEVCKSISGCSWIGDYCQCAQNPSSTCQPPALGCESGKYWDSYSCSCKSSSSGSSSSSCQEPSGGCGSNYYWDLGSCSCKSSAPTPTPTPTSTSSSSPTSTPMPTSPPTSTPTSTCQSPSTGCESGYWDDKSCSCKSSSDAEKMCVETPGCTWTGTTCQCTHGTKEHNLTYPIPQLGNCNSCEQCNEFCSNLVNYEKCVSYAKNAGFFEEQQKEIAKIFEMAKTELGCDSEQSCKVLCQKEENFDKCEIFAAKNDIEDRPVILNLKESESVSQTQNITLKAQRNATVDIMLQPINSITDTIYLGRKTFKGDLTTEDFSWDSTNTPNGEYNLIATVYDESNQVVATIGPIRVKVSNPPTPGSFEITTKDIVFPSQFKPEEVPVDKTTSINKIEVPKTQISDKGIVLQGVALPNTIVGILIYSTPIVVTVKTDANGLWKYTLEKTLDSGKHTAYVVTSRSDGTKVRSEVFSFFVLPALAAADENLNLESADESKPLQIFVYATIAIIVIAIASLLIIYRIKSRNSSRKIGL